MQEQPLDHIPTRAISSPDKFLQPETPAGFVEPSSRTSGFGQTAKAEVSSEKTSLAKNSNEDVPLVPADDEAAALTGHDDEVSKADTTVLTKRAPLPNEPVRYVREFFARNSLKMMFDDTVLQEGKPTTAHTREMVEPVLATQPLNVADVLDMIVIDCKENELKAGKIRSAFRHVVRDMKHQRRNEVLRPLLEEPTIDKMNRVSDERGRLDLLFEDMPSDLPPSCVLSQYVYQVKSKVLGRDVENHLMPVITSSVQGSGKTTFAKIFLRPLCELATGASLLSDFGDRRTIGLFRFPAVFLDDLEAIAEKDVPVITVESMHRRLLGSSMDAKVRQMSTPIATSILACHSASSGPCHKWLYGVCAPKARRADLFGLDA